MRRHLPRLDPRHRFRDRLLLAMVVVGLVPLTVFIGAVTADLGSISRSTVDETHRTIVEDQEARQQSQAADRARILDVRLSAVGGDVSALADAFSTASGKLPATPPPSRVFTQDSGAWFAGATAGGEDSTLLVASTSPLLPTVTDPARNGLVGADSTALIPLMERLRHTYPEVSGVWLADRTEQLVRTVPWMDAQRAIDSKRIDPQGPLAPSGDTVFSTSVRRMGAAQGGDLWTDPDVPSRGGTSGPFWTDPYATRGAGQTGVTVWMPVSSGRLLVGADITLADLAAQVLPSDTTGEPGAYTILLSSSDTVLSAPGQIARDFSFAAQQGNATPWLGAPLPLSGNGSLSGVERTGQAQALHLNLGGVDKVLFTAPIYTAHWVLASAVPAAALEPDAVALQRGVESGLRRILLQAIPVGIILVLLAFILASLLARRLVGPVGALTRAADRLARGHTAEPVPAQGNDEVGLLATSLEHMRQEVNSSRDAILSGAHELEERVADRTAELQLRNEELVALNTLAASLTRSLNATVILREALETLEAVLALRAACGYTAEARTLELTCGATLAQAREHGELLDRVARAALDEHALVQHRLDEGALVGIPLITHDGAVGALAVIARDADAVVRSAPLLNAIADQVALALRTAQLSEEGRDLAVLEERTRLAREIHDTLAQQLTGIVLQLEAAEAFVGRDPADARGVIVSAREQARSALQEARRSVWNLRPAPLAATGLVAALGIEVRRWSERTAIEAQLRSDGVKTPLALPPQGEVALLRILQEALANVARHAGAERVRVILSTPEGFVQLEVSDDGEGFHAGGESNPGSFGLVGMQERARLAGADLEVESAPGSGTTVRVRVPLERSTAIPA